MRTLKYLILAILISLGVTLPAQEMPPLQNFSPSAYKGGTQNWAVCQSTDGDVYIANNLGLIRFNGSRWDLFQSPNGSIIRSVAVEGDKIYTGCYMEFGYWEADDAGNLKYTSLSKSTHLLDDEQFWNIVFYKNFTMFQSYYRIYVLDNKTGKFKIISSKSAMSKLFELDGKIYFQDTGAGLFRLDNGKPVLLSDLSSIDNDLIVNVFPYEGGFFVVTRDKGCFIYNEGKLLPWKSDFISSKQSQGLYSATELSDGSFIFGTIGDGAYHVSSSGQMMSHINKSKGLQNNTILSCFEDKDNNVWLGLDNGISLFNYKSPYSIYSDLDGLVGSVYAVNIKDGLLYLGTNQGLYCKKLDSSESFRLISGTKGQVWMLKNINGTLFCGHHLGTFIIEGENARLINGRWGTWNIEEIPNRKDLLILGNYDGLHILQNIGSGWSYRNKIEGFEMSSRHIEMLNEHQVIVNHEYRGVFKLTIDPTFHRLISKQLMSGVTESPYSGLSKYEGAIYFNSKAGLYVYDDSHKCFIMDSSALAKALSDEEYVSGKMTSDDGGKVLWVFTAKNIIAVFPGTIGSESHIYKIPLPISLREDVLGYEDIHHIYGGKYILGSSSGYVIFDIDKFKNRKFSVKLNSFELMTSDHDRTSLPLTDNTKLKSNENYLVFGFCTSISDFTIKPQYRYKLSGIFNDWSQWDERPEAIFANLPSGKYKLQVEARIGNDKATDTAEFSFVIRCPWYVSLPMILVYLSALVLLVIFVDKQYRKHYHEKLSQKEKEKQLAILSNEKTIMTLQNEKLNYELEAKNRELTSKAMAIVKKNELLNTLKDELKAKTEDGDIRSAIRIIDNNLENDNDWEAFQEAFDKTDRNFLKKVKEMFPLLTHNDLKLCVYLRLNLSSKEIAPMLNISPQSVEIKRSRLRKKMGLHREVNLTDYILSL